MTTEKLLETLLIQLRGVTTSIAKCNYQIAKLKEEGKENSFLTTHQKILLNQYIGQQGQIELTIKLLIK